MGDASSKTRAAISAFLNWVSGNGRQRSAPAVKEIQLIPLESVASAIGFGYASVASSGAIGQSHAWGHLAHLLSTSPSLFTRIMLACTNPLNVRIALIVGIWTLTIAGWWLYLRTKSRQ